MRRRDALRATVAAAGALSLPLAGVEGGTVEGKHRVRLTAGPGLPGRPNVPKILLDGEDLVEKYEVRAAELRLAVEEVTTLRLDIFVGEVDFDVDGAEVELEADLRELRERYEALERRRQRLIDRENELAREERAIDDRFERLREREKELARREHRAGHDEVF